MSYVDAKRLKTHVIVRHTNLIEDNYKPIKNSTDQFVCNHCPYKNKDLRNLNEHRAVKHGLKSKHIGHNVAIECPISGDMLNISKQVFTKHIKQCKIDFENNLESIRSTTFRQDRENRFKNFKNFFPKFLDSIVKELKREKITATFTNLDLPLFFYMMTVLCLRPGIQILNGAGFFNIK